MKCVKQIVTVALAIGAPYALREIGVVGIGKQEVVAPLLLCKGELD